MHPIVVHAVGAWIVQESNDGGNFMRHITKFTPYTTIRKFVLCDFNYCADLRDGNLPNNATVIKQPKSLITLKTSLAVNNVKGILVLESVEDIANAVEARLMTHE